MALFSALSAGYSYSSEFIYDVSPNAASDGYSWVMSNILPNHSGLTVEAVEYSYKVIKEEGDWYTVTIKNKNALGAGYVFEQTDDWSNSGDIEIDRRITVGSVPLAYWGDGSISDDGLGTIESPSVVYSYRYDPCHNPQSSPACEGYEEPVDLLPTDQYIYNALEDDAVTGAFAEVDAEYSEEQEESNSEDDDSKREARIALALNAGAVATMIAQEQMLAAMNSAVNIASYYQASIQGGVYKDTNSLVDAKLPENRAGLRNGLAQQILHNKMVMEQYK